jgi:hypothetical protein
MPDAEVVGAHREGELPVEVGQPAIHHLVQADDCIGPTEGLLDAFADALGDRAGDVAADAERRPLASCATSGVTAFSGNSITSRRRRILYRRRANRVRVIGVRLDQRQRRQSFGMARSAGGHRTDDQAAAIFHPGVTNETQPRFFAWYFVEQMGIGVGG